MKFANFINRLNDFSSLSKFALAVELIETKSYIIFDMDYIAVLHNSNTGTATEAPQTSLGFVVKKPKNFQKDFLTISDIKELMLDYKNVSLESDIYMIVPDKQTIMDRLRKKPIKSAHAFIPDSIKQEEETVLLMCIISTKKEFEDKTYEISNMEPITKL